MNHLTKREKEILDVLKKEPLLPQDELAERMKITRSAAAVHISNLMRKGYIVGKGYIFDERSGILVIGKTWLEICAEVSPGSKAAAASGRIDYSFRGDGCLLALELARYRLQPSLITYLGKDELGDRICDHLMQKGANIKHIIHGSSVPTGKHLVVTDRGRVIHRIEDEGFENELGQAALAAKEDLIRSAKVMLIDGSLPAGALRFLASRAVSYNITSSVVNCPISRLQEYGYLSHPQFYLVCQAWEIAARAGMERYQDPEELFPACKQIVDEGCFAVVVLCDDQGLILASNEETDHLPAPPMQTPCSAVSIAAGIADGLASGYRLRLAVRKAMGSSASLKAENIVDDRNH